MFTEQIALLQNRLFDSSVVAASNFNLYPGTNRDETADAIATEVNQSLSRLNAGELEVYAIED